MYELWRFIALFVLINVIKHWFEAKSIKLHSKIGIRFFNVSNMIGFLTNKDSFHGADHYLINMKGTVFFGVCFFWKVLRRFMSWN